MSLAEAFAGTEAAHRSRVLAHTFGHLAPSIRKKYHGTILFTHSAYGQLVLIRADFNGLPDSPWLYDHLNDFVCERATEPGMVYRFDGSYMVFKNGNPSFKGTVTPISC